MLPSWQQSITTQLARGKATSFLVEQLFLATCLKKNIFRHQREDQKMERGRSKFNASAFQTRPAFSTVQCLGQNKEKKQSLKHNAWSLKLAFEC